MMTKFMMIMGQVYLISISHWFNAITLNARAYLLSPTGVIDGGGNDDDDDDHDYDDGTSNSCCRLYKYKMKKSS